MNEPTPLPSLLDGQESDIERRLYNARHGLADEARGHNLAPRDDEGELLHAGGASWDDLPPVEGLGEPNAQAEATPVGRDQTACPGQPYREYEIRARYPTPESMCEAWGRVNAPKEAPIRPGGTKSQLADSKGIADFLEAPVVEVEPTADQQAASEVEATPLFLEADVHLRARYVELRLLEEEGEATLARFLYALWWHYPSGFNPEPPTRAESASARIVRIQAEVAETRERGRRRSA